MKRITMIIMALGMLVLAASCANRDATAAGKIGGRTFVWEKKGFGGSFTITLNKDGTYQYFEGFLSSYMGLGDWTVKDGVLTLNEKGGYDNVFRFAVRDGDLFFISEGSSQFMHVTVEDGDRFAPREKK